MGGYVDLHMKPYVVLYISILRVRNGWGERWKISTWDQNIYEIYILTKNIYFEQSFKLCQLYFIAKGVLLWSLPTATANCASGLPFSGWVLTQV